ncbi:hypothetical protein GCM10010329_44960 [Streptomyces spiroverticillatus]|uniref:Uncharacterized protein n=1 Tax=Streptomyces finlayi TaxID=67296 RepID=A0A918WZP4_9ACTN|nr:hypothetical protein [Streptomyces finlayi]GHA16927.1 hypothetical protein GCM10010329_44960 [Streptomyces spiroverticillatus]GHC99036.1 hypothetical protein GCM10010334_42140 [Streptomyces finlayi]
MRWLTLYARSRQVPATLAVLLAGAAAMWALTRAFSEGDGGPADPRLSALALTVAAMAVSVGLGGQDPALDRTAALAWIPRRAAHLALGGVLAGAVLLGVQVLSGQETSVGLVVRDAAGLMGLVGLGAAWCGRQYAWLPAFAWLAVSFVVPPSPDGATQVLTWMLSAPEAPGAAWTAGVLGAGGLVAYGVGGVRR